MPSDTTTAEFRDQMSIGHLRADDSRSLPAGAGLAIGVLVGSAFWAGLAMLILL